MQPAELATALTQSGIAHVRGLGSYAAFRALASQLGRELLETRVTLNPAARTYLASPAAVPLHMDHPEVSKIGWYCEAQDETDGACQFVDFRDLVDADLAKALEEEKLRVPDLRGLAPIVPVPVPVAGGGRYFYAPWLVERWSPALRELEQRIENAPRRWLRLLPGDAVFVDNRRVLHGRDELDERSRRLLLRVWLE